MKTVELAVYRIVASDGLSTVNFDYSPGPRWYPEHFAHYFGIFTHVASERGLDTARTWWWSEGVIRRDAMPVSA